MLTDEIMKLLGLGGLLIYVVAAGLMFAGRMGHWPLITAVVVVTFGMIAVTLLNGGPWNAKDFLILSFFFLGCVGAVVWQVAASSKWSMAALVLAACLQVLLILSIVLFLLFFRMNRLW